MRIVAVLGLAAVFLVLLGTAHAVPIKPDLREILQQPSTRTGDYAPARAGWDGPESARPMAPSALAIKQAMEERPADLRHTLLRVVLPDPRMLAAVAVAIFALRTFEQKKRGRGQLITMGQDQREPLAA